MMSLRGRSLPEAISLKNTGIASPPKSTPALVGGARENGGSQ